MRPRKNTDHAMNVSVVDSKFVYPYFNNSNNRYKAGLGRIARTAFFLNRTVNIAGRFALKRYVIYLPCSLSWGYLAYIVKISNKMQQNANFS